MFSKSTILITGGTGSLGQALTKYILNNYPEIKRLIIFSRDEQKQFQMSQVFSQEKYPQMRYFIGDVRDKERVIRAFQGVDYVIHAAALKHVPIAEYNPDEFIKTNIFGAQNVIHASYEAGVKRVVALSTDKACSPINLYGATKLTSDKLFIAANNIWGNSPVRYSVVRYGNVMGSNGSVIPFFINKKADGVFPITDPAMTRFNITLDGGVEMVIHALENAWGGELFVPKIPSYKILDIAKAIDENCKLNIVGIRPGEKLHEEMISVSDSYYTYDLGKYYVILPHKPKWDLESFVKEFKAKKVPEKFQYNSDQNTEWESVESLKKLISDL
jgi:UDP-N-acetylglucosamine 4,6-dehydratase